MQIVLRVTATLPDFVFDSNANALGGLRAGRRQSRCRISPESWIRETRFEPFLMNFAFDPGEQPGVGVVVCDEGIDVLLEFGYAIEGSALQGFAAQY
jgi:hypothetical protein